MSLLRNNYIVLLCAIICVSCGFADLRPIGMSVIPDGNNSILQNEYSPVILKFDTEMEKYQTEGILQVSSDSGSVSGDKHWKGNDLYFTPVQGWTAGVRYTLNLAGTIQSADGRDSRIEKFITFYSINKNPPPLLDIHYPLNGSSTGAKNPVFEFYFSRSMNRQLTEAALIIDGSGNKYFEWFDDYKILKVTLDKELSPWTKYNWSLKESAKSADGVPLPKTYSGYFITDLDKTLPQVTGVYPVNYSDGSWYQAGTNLQTGLFPGYGIGISFNKPMSENILRSLRFEPSLTGRTEFLSEDSVVYIFTKNPEPETVFTLIVSGDAKDKEGLKIGSDYKITFSADIPYLKINTINFNNSFETDVLISGDLINVNVTPGTGQLSLSIHFSLNFTNKEKQNTPQRITLSPFFPKSLKPIALNSVNWIFDNFLIMKWEGLSRSEKDEPHYYKLVIPGGKGGITSDAGIFMKEDLVLYLEVS